jgi:MFS family permease
VALLVDAVGGGLLRPFLLLYGIAVMGLNVAQAGLALSAGLLAGLAMLPFVGRWIDRGARSSVVTVTLLVRAAGVVVLLAGSGQLAFVLSSVLLGLGGQAWPAAHAAVIAELTKGRQRDGALAAGRAVRNAGLGAGALVATIAVAGGGTVLKGLATATAALFFIAGLLVSSMRLRAVQADRVPISKAPLGHLNALMWANLPFALCFHVLEVVLPALMLTQLRVSPAWSAGMFVGNTVLVIATQVPLVAWLSKWPRHTVFAASGVVLSLSYLGFWAGAAMGSTTGAVAVAAVCVVYTMGEILYTGSGTALVIASAPPQLLGRALVRFQLSTGVGMALAPAILMGLLTMGPWALWGFLALATLAGAALVLRPYGKELGVAHRGNTDVSRVGAQAG